MIFIHFLWVGAGAACGAMLRYALNELLSPVCSLLNLGTFAANVSAAYMMGVVLVLSMEYPMSPQVKLLIVTGFLGGLSTFSSWNAELWQAWQFSRYASLFWTFFGHIVATWMGVILGGFTVHYLMKIKQLF